MDCLGVFASPTLRGKRQYVRGTDGNTVNNIVEASGEESLQANQMVTDRKRAISLTEVGADVYATLSNLLAESCQTQGHAVHGHSVSLCEI